jgi:hypothetical protein
MSFVKRVASWLAREMETDVCDGRKFVDRLEVNYGHCHGPERNAGPAFFL